VAAILQGKVEAAGLSGAEQALLGYAKLITEAAHRSSGEDVQKLRDLGWKEEQIAEAVYIIALFAFFNRVADAFGLPSPNYLASVQETTP
jgi:alkylhydroperoxidase family enzyme